MQRGAGAWMWSDEAEHHGSAIVALVGRPNVGKSTLFNRLVGRRHSIVDDQPGLTRDRIYGLTEWQGTLFTIVDTAGLVTDEHEPDVLLRAMQSQSHRVLDDADVICFMIDVRDGITREDEEIAERLRKLAKPLILVANKGEARYPDITECYRLGFGEPIVISALHGQGTGDLLDAVIEHLPERSTAEEATAVEYAFAIIGRPNVGKSSILNALVGDERALVSPIAGTTRDAIDTIIELGGERIRLVDTAGIRKHGAVSTNAEQYSVLRALRALQHCDVAILVIDANEGVVSQDRHVAGYAIDAGKGVVLVPNKWDLLDQETREDPAFLNQLRHDFSFIPGTPIVTASALEGRNLLKILESARNVAQSRRTHMPTHMLNELIRDAVASHPPTISRGRRLKILYATQAEANAPTVVLFVNDPELVHFSYLRYLENRIRSVFAFPGVRIHFTVRKRHADDA